jgi:hypothetical protein
MGFYIFDYRLGELVIGAATLLYLLFFILIPVIKKKYFLNSKKLTYSFVLLLSIFLLINIDNNISLTEPTIYKNSTYIWAFGALTIGIKISQRFDHMLIRENIYLPLVGLFVIYLYSTRGISENLQNYFLNYSDKFEYPKGSDILLAFIIIFYFVLSKLNFSNYALNIYLVFFATFAPLFLVKSRSGFFSLIIFTIFVIVQFKKKYVGFDKSTIIFFMISIIVFLISTSWVVGKDVVIDQDISEDLKFAITNRYSTINDNQYEKEILQLSLFYFRDNRIFSTDGNLNWRFQIWQDVYQDLNKDNKFLTGYGFHSAIPAMDNDQRYGQDQLNIQVHNYLVHILSRGGLLHLITICFIYYLLYVIFKSRNLEINYLMLVTPLLFNSLFDPSMENAHYSVILFAVIGLIYNHNRIFKKDIKI